jgi:hypothetical protein
MIFEWEKCLYKYYMNFWSNNDDLINVIWVSGATTMMNIELKYKKYSYI